ncbi:MAG TPA: transporter substrate-binding domain-containing protein, partial [Geobacteraceae bacterium]|nr:transporter substrate-binding domain-containing protein [Geobacteraceae bacterium]
MFAKPLTFYHDNRRLIVVGLLALFIGLPLVAVLHKKADTVTLTAEESAWLKAHPVIRVAPDPDFPPTEFFDSNGEYSGIAADYLALLQKKLGIRFKIVKLRDWAEVLKKARQREVDVLAAVTKTPERSEFLCFTKPYLEFPAVIITRDTYAGPLNLKSLAGKRMSVKAGYGARYYVITNYPNIRVDVVPDINTGLRKVSFGMRDALLENLLTASYYMEKEVINNLRIAGETEYVYRMAFAVRNDWPVLRGILDKGLNLITSDERDVIYNKWVPLNAQFLLINKRITPPLVMVAGLLVLFVVLVFFWNRSLTRQVSARTRELNSELSERCRIESALRESEQKFRVLAETSPVAIILYQGEDLVYINPSLSKLTGYSKHQLMSMKFWEWTDGDAQLTVKAYGMARQQGEPVPESYEAKFRTKDGEQKCVMVSAG